jgi:hypothetical protein
MNYASGLNINTFYSNLKSNGVMLQNYWNVIVSNLPPGVNDVNTLQFYALNFPVPGIKQNMNNIPWLGKNFYVPGTFQHDQEATLTVRCDQYNVIYHKMLNWIDSISMHAHRDEDFNSGAATMGGVKLQNSTAEIAIFSDQGNSGDLPFNNPTAVYRLYGFYPKSTGGIEMTNTAEGVKVSTFNCNFAFQYFDKIV